MDKINQHEYQSPDQWMQDIHLLVNNAIQYNEKGHDITNKAYELKELAEGLEISPQLRQNCIIANLWRRHQEKQQAGWL